MAFMTRDIYSGRYYAVSVEHGSTAYLPADVCSPEDVAEYVEGRVDLDEDGEPIVETLIGVLGRLSAPGYMDCTDWTTYGSVDEAAQELAEEHGMCPECESDVDENGNCETCSADTN